MSVEVHIPKEINQYEAKLVGPFTARQVVVIIIFAPIIVLLFNFVRSFSTTDVAGFVVLFPAVIAALFGWVKPYGMKFETFLASVFINTVVAPSKRPYVTKNYFEQFTDIVLKDEVVEKIEQELNQFEFDDDGVTIKKKKEEDYILEDFYLDPAAKDLILNSPSHIYVKPNSLDPEEPEPVQEKPQPIKKGREKKPKKEKYIKSKKAMK